MSEACRLCGSETHETLRYMGAEIPICPDFDAYFPGQGMVCIDLRLGGTQDTGGPPPSDPAPAGGLQHLEAQ